jgi:ribonuclease BN (tRNA processing enzyme)
MQVKFFGVRGSYPVPGEHTFRYGGNTTSVMIYKEFDGVIVPLLIDSGTGIVNAGKELLSRMFAGTCTKSVTMLFTHLHPDHTQGFTFFAPNFMPWVDIDLAGPESLEQNVGTVLKGNMTPPTYPIEYSDLKSKRKHWVIADGDTWYIGRNGKLEVPGQSAHPIFEIKAMAAFAPSHPQQGAMYYRVTDCETQQSIACIWDIESRHGGDQRVIAFAKGADVMIHDTQYTTDEYNSSKMVVQGFGHSTYEMAIDNCKAAGCKALVPIHYNPNHSDDFLNEWFTNLKSDILIVPSKEGALFTVESLLGLSAV